MAWDVFYAHLLIVCKSTHYFITPDISHEHRLILTWNYTNILEVKGKFGMSHFVPVHDEGSRVAHGKLSRIDLGRAPELRPPVTSDHADSLS